MDIEAVEADLRAQKIMAIVLQFASSNPASKGLAAGGLKRKFFDYSSLQLCGNQELSHAFSEVRGAAGQFRSQKRAGLAPLLRSDATEINGQCGTVRVSADGKHAGTVNRTFEIHAAHETEVHTKIPEILAMTSKAQRILARAIENSGVKKTQPASAAMTL